MRPQLWFVLMLLASPGVAAESPQQFAAIGDLPLASGEILRDVTLGYRTAGALNADQSNVIVFPTWFTGSSADLLKRDKIGAGKLADTDRFYVIAIDALGNGVSTSPSNSKRQPGADFPAIQIDDMVNAAHTLVTRHLGLGHVHAVMGISMGGMQTFQWIAQYPDFMDRAVPLDGTPKMTSYDLVVWQAHEQAISLLQAKGAAPAEIMGLIDSLGLLSLWTPDWFVANVPAEQLAAFRAANASGQEPTDPNDYLAQLRAMIAHDAFADFAAAEGGYPGRIAAELLVVGVPDDHLVNPAPGKALAAAIGARYAEIHSNCGHIGTSCEAWKVEALVNDFLAEN